ncbi:hypothetical protein SKL01_11490 [Staphylococcus kloosii]|uniref:Uncharacterized protein n=1 Tax=Staphylococcus kloosii TaxID=29384 RepID=A0ABQ0XKK0_9STAP|nr:hypothetical protein SKL01_11490 [Staphylococcus kloosii]
MQQIGKLNFSIIKNMNKQIVKFLEGVIIKVGNKFGNCFNE